jgi:hypothetical protein
MMEREVKMTEMAVREKVDISKIQADAGIKKYQTDVGIKQFYEELAEKRRNGSEANYGLEAEPA